METPKEKAESLVKKFWMKNKNGQDSYVCAVDCAKIAVEEIIKYGGTLFVIEYPKNIYKNGMDFWREVKTELNKL